MQYNTPGMDHSHFGGGRGGGEGGCGGGGRGEGGEGGLGRGGGKGGRGGVGGGEGGGGVTHAHMVCLPPSASLQDAPPLLAVKHMACT